jgi:hypothetical protein
MLITIQLCDGESGRWAKCAELRSTLKTYSAAHARKAGRRFWQIVAAGGQILAIGEIA